VLPFPAASAAASAARSTVTGPSAIGVTVTSYVRPVPDRRVAVPLPTVRSSAVVGFAGEIVTSGGWRVPL
jgi:hypothetical protein